MQLSGQSAEAKKCYKILMQHDHHAITATIGLSTLELEKEDTDEVESRLDLDASSLTLVQDMAANLLASFQNLSRQEKKQRLSNALRLANRAENGQLHRFILARLAEIYYSVADEQCEIMLDTAYHLAREINDHFLAIVVGGRLADLYRRHGRKEMADHLYKEVNTLKQRAYQPITDV
ncbi:hypothetical protein BDF19DRAFT_150187 [Syncephalis fuscata]|nr:hypothetical protein BDF19DRAFT_150187 [Syncephalis fuscata]